MPKRWTPSLEDYADLAAYLPDANKRAAFLLTARFLHANGSAWGPQHTEVDASMIEQIAASKVEHAEVLAWTRRRIA